MTNRERMLAAYRRQKPDQVPVSPELYYDIPILIDKSCTWQDVCLGKYPIWKIQLTAHRYFGSAAWLVGMAPGGGKIDGEITTKSSMHPDGYLENCYTGKCSKGTLTWSMRANESHCNWLCEHPIKDLDRDMEAFECLFFPDPATMDVLDIKNALAEIGDDGVVTPCINTLFFSFIASFLEGGPASTILAFVDRRSYFEELQQKYTDWCVKIADKMFAECKPAVILIDCGYSTSGIISPAMYNKWDMPVLKAVTKRAHENGALVHLHQHGKCSALLDLLLEADVDLVDPFERPLSGDTADLQAVKNKIGHRIAIRGNMHSHDVLLNGTVQDVEDQARECIEAAAPGGGFILASGDGVIAGTPFENIFKMVEAAQKYGKY